MQLLQAAGVTLGVPGFIGKRLALLLQGRGEIPPGATLSLDIELLSIKQDSRGYQVKLVEG